MLFSYKNYNGIIGHTGMDAIIVKETNEPWSVSSRQINYYCTDGRILGAVKMAGVWLIPKEAEKPKDRWYNESG